MQACSPASAVHSLSFCRSVSTTVRLSTTKWGASRHRVKLWPSKQHRLICCSSSCEPTTVLPSGLAVCYASKYDVDFLYREIFTEKTYLQHGIQLAEGNIVIDVGGNIGFFALFAAEYVGSHGTVITAEPIPDLHAKLQYNVHSHLHWCASQGNMPLLARTGLALHMLCNACLVSNVLIHLTLCNISEQCNYREVSRADHCSPLWCWFRAGRHNGFHFLPLSCRLCTATIVSFPSNLVHAFVCWCSH